MRTPIWILAAALAVAVSGCGGGSSSDASPEDSTPIRTEIVVASDFQGTAMVGEPYEGEMSVVAVDARNTITSMAVENLTAGGAQPSINAAGKLVWTPNAADFATRSLTVKVVSAHGGETAVTMPARVGRKEVIHRIPIDDGEGVYTDPAGDFRIRVKKDNESAPVSGTIVVFQMSTNTGARGYEYFVENGENFNLELLEEPRFQSASDAPIVTQSDNSVMRWETKIDGSMVDYVVRVKIPSIRDSSFVEVENLRNLWTTRKSVRAHPGSPTNPSLFPKDHIASVFSNCYSDCKVAKFIKEPIVLIHGFTPTGMGGGEGSDGTWGELPATLTNNGHPVFEVRWRTYMRFEEAAYILKEAVDRAASLTGKKVVVVGHSFGGIVAHTLAQGKAENFEVWNPPSDGTFIGPASVWKQFSTENLARIVTINSPLSGIAGDAVKNVRPGFSLTAGRDANDATIFVGCKSINCFQAGEPVEISSSLAYLGLKDGGIGESGIFPARGSIIQKIQSGRTTIPYHVVVGLTEEIERCATAAEGGLRTECVLFPDESKFAKNYQGDGLISLLGQAVNPGDFIEGPYEASGGNTGTSVPFKSFEMVEKFNRQPFGTCLKHNVNGVDYRLCRRSAHTNSIGGVIHRKIGKTGRTADFASAFYEVNPEDFQGQNVKHPLHGLLIDSTSPDYLLGGAVNVCEANSAPLICQPSWKAKGQVNFDGSSIVTQSSSPVASVVVSLAYEHKTTGASVRDFSVETVADGSFEVDIGTPLREHAGLGASIADYRLKLIIWGGTAYQTYRETIEDLVEGDNQLAPITLLPKQAALVNIAGRVIDGQTSNTGIASATVRLAIGADLDANTIRAHTDVRRLSSTNTARLITTASDGSFSTQGLRAGIYSILVSKAGYFDQLQGRITVTSNGNISLSMLRVLPAGENSVTLRWDNGSAGSTVSRDLDSHLLRLSGGSVDYHVYFENRTVSGSSDSLDRDDTDFEGPETVTFASVAGKDFVYYVHNFSGGSTSIVDSRARVTLRYAGRTLQFSPPSSGNQGARYWRVFDIVNGRIVRCVTNCLQDAAPSGIATQGEFSGIPAQWRNALTQLPSKH